MKSTWLRASLFFLAALFATAESHAQNVVIGACIKHLIKVGS